MKPIRSEVDALLLRGVFSGNAEFMGMCSELYDHREWLWTFVENKGIQPTNNASERALRPAVIWRAFMRELMPYAVSTRRPPTKWSRALWVWNGQFPTPYKTDSIPRV